MLLLPYETKGADRCASGLSFLIYVGKLGGASHCRKFHAQIFLNHSIHPLLERLQRLGTLIMLKQTMMSARQSGCSVSS